MGAGVDADLDLDRPDLLGAAPVGTALVDGDLLPHEVLVDRLARLLDLRLGLRVLRGGQRLARVGIDRSAPDRERQLDLVDDPVEQKLPLRRLERLRVLLGIGERLQLVAELLPHRAFDRDGPLLLEQQRQRRLDLHLALDVVVGRLHRDRPGELGEELLDDRAGLLDAGLLDALPDGVPLVALELGDEIEVEPLRLAGLAAQVLLRLAQLHDLAVRELERLEDLLLGNLVRACLDHRQPVLRADDDQVELAVVLTLAQRRVDDELPVDEPDADGADRAEERQRREHQRGRSAVDAKDVVGRDHVRAEDGADHLHLVAEALRPERPNRPVDHACREDGALGRAPLTLEEAARDLAGGVHPLLDVDGEREEVCALARLGASLGCGEHHRVASADDDSAVRLLREMAGFEADLLGSDLDGDLRPALGRDTHQLSSTLLVEGGSSSQPIGCCGGLARTSTLRVLGANGVGRAP